MTTIDTELALQTHSYNYPTHSIKLTIHHIYVYIYIYIYLAI